MKYFDQVMQYRALAFKFSFSGGSGNALDDMLENAVTSGVVEQAIPMQNVCAKLSVDLVQQMEEKINILDISKRRFIELAVIQALHRIDEIFSELDVFENLREESKESDREAAQ